VARLLEREGLRDAVLIGHSMGGPVALEAAVRAPDRVGAIVGVESLHRLAGEADPERMAPYVARFKEDFPAAMGEFTSALVRAETPPETRARIVADSVQCDPEMAVALVEHFGTYDPKPATRIIDSPVRCINAEVTPTDVAGNRALLPSFDAVLLPETGHWPHLESPARFQAALDRLLVEVAPVPDPGSEARILTLGPTIRCEDVQATLEFYTQRLRFEEVECEPGEERPAGEAVTLVRDGATVVLQSLGGLREDLPEVTLRPGPAILRLEVTNLTAELAALGDALRVVVPERRLASGARQVVIEDPAGSLVILRQARERL
jgi:catechol 2,3-dioxygenase-like lactoylglutathione lyase family enzyme